MDEIKASNDDGASESMQPLNLQQALDWVAAPGDFYQMKYCPPPPHCSPSLYLAKTWVRTTGTISVVEPDKTGDSEVKLIRRWLHQLIFQEMPAALTQAEEELLGATPPALTDAQIMQVLSDANLPVLKRAFELRAAGVCGCAVPPAP